MSDTAVESNERWCSCLLCQSKSGQDKRKVSTSTWYNHRKRRLEESGGTVHVVPEPGPSFIAFLSQQHRRHNNTIQTGSQLAPPPKRPRRDIDAVTQASEPLQQEEIPSGIESSVLCDDLTYSSPALPATSPSTTQNNPENQLPLSPINVQDVFEPLVLDTGEEIEREALFEGTGEGHVDDNLPDPECLNDIDERPVSPVLDEANDIRYPLQDANDDTPLTEISATLEDLKVCQQFIGAIRDATLDNGQLELSVVEALRDPRASQRVNLKECPALQTGIELFINTTTASEDVYNQVRATCQRAIDRVQPGSDPIPSLYKVKEAIRMLTGIYPLIHDMCLSTCVAYTGPFKDLDQCPICTTCRFIMDGSKRIPQRQFQTIPLGPQLQALWANPDGARSMQYRRTETKKILDLIQSGQPLTEWADVYHGSQYLEAVVDGRIKDDDMVLMLSLDGAQLYASKKLDCWIYIWVVLDLEPGIRYKKRYVFPGGFIPGPNKPKNVDSFMFPGLHHLSALAKEGLVIWDGLLERTFRSHPFLHLATADGPGLTYLNGLAGHSGAYGCRLYCTVKGRRRETGTHYYPALLKPDEYDVIGCNHDDIKPDHLPGGDAEEYRKNLDKMLASRNPTQQQLNRRDTGITKPSIMSGLPPQSVQPVPLCCGVDLMHLISLNLTELLLGLWRGTLDCDSVHDSRTRWEWAVLTGETWKEHGKRVADAIPYLPGSFDRPPRNPAEKINSGYKAWEFLTYVYGLCPAFLYGVLPDIYWRSYCKLVTAIRILHQRKITKEQLVKAHRLIIEFVKEFEELYYQRLEYRLHFCRQSIHALLHLAPEIVRLGPGTYYTQWTMERTIGNLGEEIRQHSNPFQNLAERGVRRAQVNSLMSIIPDLVPPTPLPHVSVELGQGYVLLGAKEEYPHAVSSQEAAVIHRYFYPNSRSAAGCVKLHKWARLRLPNHQIVRSLWKEQKKGFRMIRIARNVMFYVDGILTPHFGEVQYFFQASTHNQVDAFAVVSEFSAPDIGLATASSGALLVCEYQGPASLRVIRATDIVSGIAMIPFKQPEDHLYFVCEKMGSEVAFLGSDV